MLLLSTESLDRYGLNRVFRFIKEAGYDGVDLKITKNYDTQDIEYLNELQKEYKLPIYSVQVADNATIAKTKKAIAVAIGVGAKKLIFEPPKLFDYNYKKWLLHEIPRVQKKENVTICIVNVPDKRHLGIVPEYQLTGISDLKRFKHVCLDTANVISRKADLMAYYGALRKYVEHVFLANGKLNSYRHYLPIQGLLPLESFLIKLKSEGYTGAISLKVDPRIMQTSGDELVLKHLGDIKKFYETYYLK